MSARIQRAILSVTDKTGLVEFARRLSALGIELISTGGTAKLLRDSAVSVKDISDLTGFPEMLDGRVKTLHPKVHGGILHRREDPKHVSAVKEHGIQPIDMVVVNLYAFEKTAAKPGVAFEELIENIDIGGPSMIRSAAKNFEDVTVIVDSTDYAAVLEEMKKNGGKVSHETRARLALKAFAATASYDGAISATLQKRANGTLPENFHLDFRKFMDLRYGENPHQKAALYRGAGGARGLSWAKQLQGKELSYNNLLDLESALRVVEEFPEPATAVIKHTNPCGVATAHTLRESYERARDADPVSAFGSVIAFNRELDAATAEAVASLFVEAIGRPGYHRQVLKKWAGKKNLRLRGWPPAVRNNKGREVKNIGGGLLVQTRDQLEATPENWKCVTERQPTDEEK